MHDEELRAGRIRMHGTGHGQNTCLMFQRIVEAVLSKFAADGVARTAGTISQRAAALDHETFDDSVESQTVIKAFFHQADEVVYRNWCDFRIKLSFDHIAVVHGNCNNWILSHNCILPF